MSHRIRRLLARIPPGALALAALASTQQASTAAAAELPRVFLDTTYAPPTGGRTIAVAAGGDLQAALDQAQPGDIVELQAGATFAGSFVLPAKAGSDWIHIRTSGLASLPPPGSRVGPADAAAMARLIDTGGNRALYSQLGAHGYRLVGIEITTTAAWSYGLVELGTDFSRTDAAGNYVVARSSAELPSDIVFDRCYVHGNAAGSVKRAFALNSRRTAVIDSYIADIHASGAEAQGIASWSGEGPFKIVDDHIEAATENILFGGAQPFYDLVTPSDIEIRGNHLVKPLSWRAGDPAFAGDAWVIKNLLELKNARRALIDGNVLENAWPQAQAGMAVLFTPLNDAGSGETADWTVVEDITFRRNLVRHATNGMQLFGAGYYGPSQGAKRIDITGNVFDDIGAYATAGLTNGLFLMTTGSVSDDVLIRHNTILNARRASGGLSGIIDSESGYHQRWTFSDNIVAHESSGVYAIDGSFYAYAPGAFTRFPAIVFTANAIAIGSGSTGLADPGNYPPGNAFVPTFGDIGFTDLAAGDYRLAATSAFHDAASDGTDVGADVGAVEASTSTAASGGTPGGGTTGGAATSGGTSGGAATGGGTSGGAATSGGTAGAGTGHRGCGRGTASAVAIGVFLAMGARRARGG